MTRERMWDTAWVALIYLGMVVHLYGLYTLGLEMEKLPGVMHLVQDNTCFACARIEYEGSSDCLPASMAEEYCSTEALSRRRKTK